jgi:hypothetical protein
VRPDRLLLDWGLGQRRAPYFHGTHLFQDQRALVQGSAGGANVVDQHDDPSVQRLP